MLGFWYAIQWLLRPQNILAIWIAVINYYITIFFLLFILKSNNRLKFLAIGDNVILIWHLLKTIATLPSFSDVFDIFIVGGN